MGPRLSARMRCFCRLLTASDCEACLVALALGSSAAPFCRPARSEDDCADGLLVNEDGSLMSSTEAAA